MKLGFIGSGKMAEAIASGLIESSTCKAGDISASDISAARRNQMQRRLGIMVTKDNLAVMQQSRVVFLAVKPQHLSDAMASIAPATTARHLVISIAAGVRIGTIEKALPKARVVRVMPNLPCQVYEGMSVYTMGHRTTSADKRTVAKLLASFGKAMLLPESKLDVVTALSGSGPAFLAYCLDCMVAGAVKNGLTRRAALELGKQTMLGTAKYLIETKMDPAVMIERVASAKGTTAAGLDVLDNPATARSIRNTIAAATKRSKELSRGL